MLRFASMLVACGMVSACTAGPSAPPPVIKTSVSGGDTFTLYWQGRNVSAQLMGATDPHWHRTWERNGRDAIEAATDCAVESVRADVDSARLEATIDCSRPAKIWI